MLLASFLIYQEIPDVRDVSYFFRHVNEYEPIIHKTVRFSHTYFHIVHDLARPLILIRWSWDIWCEMTFSYFDVNTLNSMRHI